MREPKYRAWLKPEQQMVDVYELTFLGNEIILLSYDMDIYTCDEFKLMEFTGLKDKNGVEIYEGDIVKFHNDVQSYSGVVTYMNTYGSFVIMTEGKYTYPFDYIETWYCELNELEVIGNIYENKELLEEN